MNQPAGQATYCQSKARYSWIIFRRISPYNLLDRPVDDSLGKILTPSCLVRCFTCDLYYFLWPLYGRITCWIHLGLPQPPTFFKPFVMHALNPKSPECKSRPCPCKWMLMKCMQRTCLGSLTSFPFRGKYLNAQILPSSRWFRNALAALDHKLPRSTVFLYFPANHSDLRPLKTCRYSFSLLFRISLLTSLGGNGSLRPFSSLERF